MHLECLADAHYEPRGQKADILPFRRGLY